MIDRLRRWIAFLLLTNKSFRFFRWFGVYVAPVHFYSPIPDIRELDQQPKLWTAASAMPGVKMNPEEHSEFMTKALSQFVGECEFPTHATTFPHEYFVRNSYLGYVSASAMHCIVRHYHPRRIVDIGAGFTTRVFAHAVLMNAKLGFPAKLDAIDPYPSSVLLQGFPGLTTVLAKRAQDLDIDFLTQLDANDILSIDTSHVVRTGGDVNYLYLEVLPRLKPGVLVHIHDIFLPFEYPRTWLHRRSFWNEQYLLQGFLCYNSAFKPLWGQKYAESVLQEEYELLFHGKTDYDDNFDSYSFWMQRIASLD